MTSDVSVTWLIRSDRAAVPDIHWNEPDSNQAFQQWENTVFCPRHTLAMAEIRCAMTQLVADNLAAVDPGKPNLTPVN